MYTTDVVLHEIPKYLKNGELLEYTYLSKNVNNNVNNNFEKDKYDNRFLIAFLKNINNLDKLKLLIKLYPDLDINFHNDSIYKVAAKNNNLIVLKWLYEIKQPTNKEVYNYIFEKFVYRNNINGLEWLKSIDCIKNIENRYFNTCFHFSIRKENLEILKWIINERSDSDTYDLNYLKYEKFPFLNKKILEFVLTFNISDIVQAHIMKVLITNIHVENIQLLANHYPNIDLMANNNPNVNSKITLALKNGKMGEKFINDIIWIIENFKEYIDIKASLLYCDANILKYFYENYVEDVTIIFNDMEFMKQYFLNELRSLSVGASKFYDKLKFLIEMNNNKILKHTTIEEIIEKIRNRDGCFFSICEESVKRICEIIDSTCFYRQINVYDDIIYYKNKEICNAENTYKIDGDEIENILKNTKDIDLGYLENILENNEQLFTSFRKKLMKSAAENNRTDILKFLFESSYKMDQNLIIYDSISIIYVNMDMCVIEYLFENYNFLLDINFSTVNEILRLSIINNRIDIINYFESNIGQMNLCRYGFSDIFRRCVESGNIYCAKIILKMDPDHMGLILNEDYRLHILEKELFEEYMWLLSYDNN